MAKKAVTDEAIGVLVRAMRHRRELGQPELGKALGVSSMMIQKFETGASALKVTQLVKIAETLKCEVMELIP